MLKHVPRSAAFLDRRSLLGYTSDRRGPFGIDSETLLMAVVHRRVIYRGRVQGVGFRATTSRLASGFQVTGYVKNLDDGSVEVVASGEADEVDRFLAAIDRQFGGKIHHRGVSDDFSDSGEPSGFSIRY